MKKLLFILLFIPALAFSQTNAPQMTFNTLTDLRGSGGTSNVQVLLNGLTAVDDGNGGVYRWDAASTESDNGFTIVKATPVATGRWKRIGNGNTLKGSITFSGVTLTTTYTVAYQTPLTFTPITVIIIPRSANAAALSYVTNITNTSFQVVFLTVPVLGTNNISFDYCVIKQ